jgi:hypothetical protein
MYITHLPVKLLDFDPMNPRWPRYLAKGDDGEIIEWMLREANAVELMVSIGAQGYFEGEPLIVVPSKTEPKHFEVVEGNRRLTAVKLLSRPELATTRKKAVREAADAAKHKPKDLPVLIFDNREQILRYLAYRHVTGIEPWEPLQKARYLEQLASSTDFKKLPKDELRRRLAKEIGSNSNYVARLLTGLAVYEEIENANFFDIPDLDERTISYSVLTTALTYEKLAKHIGLESPTDDNVKNIKKAGLKELVTWLFEKNREGQTRLGESRNLQKLARVVATSRALKRFRAGKPLAEADLLTSGAAESFRASVSEAKGRLEAARDCVHLVEVFTAEDADLLKEIQALTRLLTTHVDDRLMDSPKKPS